ncbi:MAG TPA: M20/M25/M40 family metallo-hydrolase [Longimicrobiales bacterium]
MSRNSPGRSTAAVVPNTAAVRGALHRAVRACVARRIRIPRAAAAHVLAAALLGLAALPAALAAQEAGGDPAAAALSDWVALTAPTGHEARAAEPLVAALPGWRLDPAGNLFLRRGSGRPRRVVACGIDRVAYAVSRITDDGYLRLHDLGGGRRHPLWDQSHEGQRVRVLTRTGAVPAVTGIPNAHFSRHHPGDTLVTTDDALWVDVGAASRAEVEALGIRLLDPVVREWTGWRYAGHVAGPAAAARVGCAAVAAAARGEVREGETIFLLTTLRGFGHDGLGAALARLGPVDEVVLVDGPVRGRPGDGAVRRRIERPRFVPTSAGIDSITVLGAPARFAGTLVESVRLDDAAALLAAVAAAAGAEEPGDDAWVRIPGVAEPPPAPAGDDSLATVAALLARLSDIPGVSGHEAAVREAVLAALPDWARERAVVEPSGTIVLALGPDRDTTVFVAHLDETGYEVRRIRPDGTVELRNRGGMMRSAWEGQPALIHFDAGPDGRGRAPIPGIFIPRDDPASKQPRELLAWFGVDSAGLAALGVRPGQAVTMPKRATRLAGSRFTARGLDDRTGSTALVLAARRIDPDRLSRKVIFAWATEEEVGLLGASALAERLGPTVRRAYSIDTFVSSDTPLESPHFAFAPLGDGAVIRALDNASVTPSTEIDRILAIARDARIPIQLGTTDGGTDGSSFVPYGAVQAGLSWPGRYSHSPAEVLDLRDVTALVRLVRALAEAPARVSIGAGGR